MKSNEIEEKLERDSVTIKEQILSLQNTIKKLKTDMLTSSQSQNQSQSFQANKIGEMKREAFVPQAQKDNNEDNDEDKDSNDNSPVLGNRCSEANKNNNSNYNNDYEGDMMGFSFNNNPHQQIINNNTNNNQSKQANKSSSNKDIANDNQRTINTNTYIKSDNYGDININPIKKSNTNHKPFYTATSASNIISAPSSDKKENKYDLLSKRNFYQENINKIRQEKELIQRMEKVREEIRPQRMTIDRNNNNNDEDDESENGSDDDNTFDKVFMPNKNKRIIEDKYHNSDLYADSNTRNNANNNNLHDINNNANNYCNRNYDDYDSKCNIGSVRKKPPLKYLRESDIEESSGNELQIEDLLKEPKKIIPSNKEEKDDSISLDDTIKKLQKQKFTIAKTSPKPKTPNVPTTPKANMIKKHNTNKTVTPLSTNRINTQRPKSSQRIIHQKNMSTNYTNNNNKNHTISTPGNIITPPNTIPTPNNQLKEIKSYQTEISSLKNTILKLKADNDKLKSSLLKEKSQNAKYKELTEEIIRHYEKTKKPLTNN